MEKLWYVVNTYSGHENKVKEKLEARTESMGMQDYIFRVIVPETTEVEVKDGVKKEKVKKMFPRILPIMQQQSMCQLMQAKLIADGRHGRASLPWHSRRAMR